jgi:glycosyltransferase involved in cell wall biosynthesis
MKVNQIISSIDKNSGGTATYVQILSKALLKQKINLTVSTLKTKYPLNFSENVELIHCENNRHEILNKNLSFDIFHVNGIWELFVHNMTLLAKSNNTPYVISPHGMLEEWSLNQRKFKKKIAMFLYQKKDLIDAACIHVTAHSEMLSVRKLGFENPIAVIPNGIDVSSFPNVENKKINIKKTLLFLSRIHPKKGIENLIQAWSELDHFEKKNWKIKIIGNGEPKYIQKLKKEIINKNLCEIIKILPPEFCNEKKMAIFRNADVFVLPTFSENFGIVIAEALASYTPVITTKGTPWEDLNKKNCGWWIEIGVDPLKNALKDMLSKDSVMLNKMGKNARKLVEEKYSIDVIANNTMKMYKWIINQENKPDFIY